jgi:hypothetical protein
VVGIDQGQLDERGSGGGKQHSLRSGRNSVRSLMPTTLAEVRKFMVMRDLKPAETSQGPWSTAPNWSVTLSSIEVPMN